MIAAAPALPDGLVAVVKRDCPTCGLVAPVLGQIAARGQVLTVYTQDDPDFPATVAPRIDDRALEVSWHHRIETVPTLLRIERGVEVARTEGWSRADWERLAGVSPLGEGLPPHRPGCGSRSVEPAMAEALRVRFEGDRLHARRIELGEIEDEIETAFERGWTDGLPVVPPTPGRVLRMLDGTPRAPGEVVAIVPPDLVPITVEKVAINAVMAGCKPEYLPVVLAAVEAACTDAFNMHGLLCTTYFSGPVIVVNGPIAAQIGMNSGVNCLGQGNRANATIGRALQLVVRNVGGGVPGGIDRATFGSPGKLTFCFAEDEAGSPWESLAVERGFAAGVSTVSLFPGHGPSAIVDQISRTPESLARTLAAKLRATSHPKLVLGMGAMLIVSPEHARVFASAGWTKARLRAELDALLLIDGAELARGAGGIEEGVPAELAAGRKLPKFRPGDLAIVHAGGTAGMFSAIVEGWVSGERGSQLTTLEVRP
ncbi:MAG TPA: thioredoxin family protein [Kofleriaceae bacterium]|nr:thioredoxin family protein [Kofleriaceae bacterium]